VPQPTPSDDEIASELAEIVNRLASLTRSDADQDTIGAELGAIRVQLRRLAEQNAEVAARLSVLLGLDPPVQ
jgi:hypothetical protein